MHRSSVRVRRRVPTWVTTISSGTLAATGGKVNIDLWSGLEVAGASALGLTVIRTLLKLQFGAFSAQGTYCIVGLIVDDKETVGTTVDFASNQNRDWYFYDAVFPAQTGSATTYTTYPSDGHSLDIRAKRKSNDLNRTSMLCLTAVNGASTLAYQSFCRQLVFLP
jgi:hypothetical protein